MPVRYSDLASSQGRWDRQPSLSSDFISSRYARSEIEKSSFVHEASAAAGYSSIPQYVESLQGDPDTLARVEWTARFEAELMKRLKAVGWDPSNVTAASTAEALTKIGLPVTGWNGGGNSGLLSLPKVDPLRGQEAGLAAMAAMAKLAGQPMKAMSGGAPPGFFDDDPSSGEGERARFIGESGNRLPEGAALARARERRRLNGFFDPTRELHDAPPSFFDDRSSGQGERAEFIGESGNRLPVGAALEWASERRQLNGFFDPTRELYDGREPGLDNLSGGGGVTMPMTTPRGCADTAQSRTGGLFAGCGIIGGGGDPIDPVARAGDDFDPTTEVSFWMQPDNPCYGIDPSLILGVGDPRPAEGEDHVGGRYPSDMVTEDGRYIGPENRWVYANQMEQYWTEQHNEAEADRYDAEVAQAAAEDRLDEIRNQSAGMGALVKELLKDEKAALEARLQGLPGIIQDAKERKEKALKELGPIRDYLENPDDYENIRNLNMPVRAFPNPDGIQLEACRSSLGPALLECGFFPGGSAGTMDCQAPLVQCGSGAMDCPPVCGCVGENGERCTTLISKGGGTGPKVCTDGQGHWSYPDGGRGLIGGIGGGTCDVGCCSFAAGGWPEKCPGVSCASCRGGAAPNAPSLCESPTLSSDLFLRLGCGYTDPMRGSRYGNGKQWRDGSARL